MSEQGRTAITESILRAFLLPPHIMGKDTTAPLIVRQWQAGYFGEPSNSMSRVRALRELDSGSHEVPGEQP